ncbi:hypothetical protein OF897_12065 [Chryseobacterium formosus]|uniref:Uncharacterized protein n=1 Tax=Chryseobacterium formosus TaxID=1537363 RepID=A0ABT3XR93_9FLAO|nr:hypothetical protein [Chryseobacterium formosus]MCX8524648.1 hypothetical protein [Chryseobacterium formosus]
MAKNIKAIKCPHCGSIKKTEIKTDHFRCLNCDTEYFLDNDDINININHTPYQASVQSPIAKKNTTAVVITAILLGLTLFIVINYFTKNSSEAASTEPEKIKYDYYGGQIVYQNTNTGKAVFLRLGREGIAGKDNSIDYVNTHAVFIDPVSKKQFKDDLVFERTRRLEQYQSTFKVFKDGTIYMTYPGEKIFTVDRKNDKLVELTQSIFSKHPEMSSGIAKISLNDDYFDLMANDGKTYYYVPKVHLLTNDRDEANKAIYSTYPKNWLKFDVFSSDNLMKMTLDKTTLKPSGIDLLPDRKFFRPQLLYQDAKNLIIATYATANTDGPVMLQSLNVNTGAIIWSQPAVTFIYRSAAKCNEGFAIEYASDDDHDYISGVLIISPEGKVVSDYLIKRGE